ncbi:MAG: N-6 DNA methylase [Malacoplasma sp.]
MARNDKTFLNLYELLRSKDFKCEWKESTSDRFIQEILNHSSKKNNGNYGLPDFIYENENEKLLIMVEFKSSISQHKKEAIPQIKHYINCFEEKYMSQFTKIDDALKDSFMAMKKWNIVGIAVSGNVKEDSMHLIDTYYLNEENIDDLSICEIHDEDEYLALFNNIDMEKISEKVSNSANKINNLLYEVKEDKRPTLLSILMISLFENKDFKNYFREDFLGYDSEYIIMTIPNVLEQVLGKSGAQIPREKIEMILREYETFKNEKVLLNSEIVKTILLELKNNVIPLFSTRNNYDIIGKFYQEFLRYAGIVDVQSGIILTPEHISELFTELVDLKRDDIIFDSCCGTGSFLVAGMNKLLKMQSTEAEKLHVREKQIIGNELKAHMYILAISNMIFRGDGKSNILNQDFFSKEFDDEFYGDGGDKKGIIHTVGQPTIGFINPPYSGSFTDYSKLKEFRKDPKKSKDKKPWMKEIVFLEKMCKICSRYVVMIAPPQTYMSEELLRDNILKDNTLKAVITMPKDLFEPNASTGSAIIVLETRRKHDFDVPVIFYNLTKDGYELSKKKGRRDVYNKWGQIKKKLLNDLDAPHYRSPLNLNNITNLQTQIGKEDEWLIQAHSLVDFKKLNKTNFERTIKEYVIYKSKKELGFIDKGLDEADLLTIFADINKESFNSKTVDLDFDKMKCFYLDSKKYKENGIFMIRGTKKKITKKDLRFGEYNYISTSNKNNGVSGFHNEYYEDENTFTIDSATNGKCFFQSEKYIGSDHVEVLIPVAKYYNNINIYTALYLQTLLNFYLDKYEYSRKRAQIRIKKEYLLLPIDSKNNIDWAFMEEYIKSLPYTKYL